ncbi:M12 family metallopeptidase [Chitinophaga agri]|uniref:Peptidase metallopeptidase domain-containing protein n=1 Tax=Chitinophaga agri TaxID=2703787 RepID=A0A6B9Z7Y1_9BACT|nr:M12 family metallopeptidase [Chitinophaga agri]QHS58348.1 hypothetical protein GWR21_01680 [Chitinophaga agri]
MAHQQIMEGFPHHIQEKLAQRENERLALPAYISGKAKSLVFENLKLWQTGSLLVSFKGGNSTLHKAIADTAKIWSRFANITFDFGNEAKQQYRGWTADDDSHIRVGFDYDGYWSLVGTDSRDTAIVSAGDITLNLSGFDQGLPRDWEGIVLHEFGHAIGFHHEHATPDIPCDFDWDKVYEYLAQPPNRWSKEKVDFNLRQMPAAGLTYGPHDKHSVMHYSFPDWMFVSGAASPCCTPVNNSLSAEDQRMATKAYPFNKEAFAAGSLFKKEALEDLLAIGANGSDHFAKHLSYLKEDQSYRNFF